MYRSRYGDAAELEAAATRRGGALRDNLDRWAAEVAHPGTLGGVHQRFCVALLIHDRVSCVAGDTVAFAKRLRDRCSAYDTDTRALPRCSAGDVEAYLSEAALLARRLRTFCDALNWHAAATAVTSMREKLSKGAPDELLTIMRASKTINPTIARRLYDAGFDDAGDLATADLKDVLKALRLHVAFSEHASDHRHHDDQTLALKIIQDAATYKRRRDRDAAAAAAASQDDASSDDAHDDSDDDSADDPDLPEEPDDDPFD